MAAAVQTAAGGRRLAAARAIWPVVAVLSLAAFALKLVIGYGHLTDLSPEQARSLARAGLSEQGYALIRLGFDAAFVAVFSGVAALIYLRRPRDRMALLTALALVIWGPHNGSVVAGDYLPAAATGPEAAAAGLLGLLAYLSWVLFFYLFPSGRFVPGWTRYLAVAWALTALTWNTPIGIPQWPAVAGTAATAVLWASFPAAQLYRYWRVSTPRERLQTKWVVLGITAGVAGYALAGTSFWQHVGLPPAVTGGPRVLLVEIGLQHLFLTLIPISIGIAILRDHLFDIDVILSRTLVYGALTVMVVGGYVLIVGGVGSLIFSRQSLLLSVVATGLIAIAFQPLRHQLQKAANRLIYGYRDEPYVAISRLGRQLDVAQTPEAMLPMVVVSIQEALKLRYVSIVLADGGSAAVEAGDSSGAVEEVPLVFAGEEVGTLRLGRRSGAGRWAAGERELLADLARVATVVVESVHLNRELQQERERLVVSREEERRRLRRDLHDELGPTLAGLALRASTAADLMPRDPPRARQILRELQSSLRDSVGTVRELARDLRPPTLDELGLVAAIRERADQLASADAGLRMRLDLPEALPPLSAACEVAAYRIAQEALLNVVSHARAKTCTVSLALRRRGAGTDLELSIDDDGIGLDPTHRLGVGLLSMQERAVELGGSCRFEPGAGGGTRVLARLPNGSAAADPEGEDGATSRSDR
jgi:signal transduction histidine kinase